MGRMLLVPLLFLTIIGLASYYLASRVAFATGVGKWWLFAAFVVLAFFSINSMMAAKNYFPVLHPVVVVLSAMVGVLLYMLMVMLLTDIANMFAHFQPKTFGLIAATGTILISAFGIVNTSWPRLKTVDIELPKLTEPVQIAQLSDVHLGHFRGRRNK